MGKRGPAPKGEYVGQTAVLSTRITPELRARLETEVEKTGKTLSREIEHRLRRSFLDDGSIVDAFGNRRDYAIMRMLASFIEPMTNLNSRRSDWTKDPYLFEQIVQAFNTALEIIRPEGDVPLGEKGLESGGNKQGKLRAALLLENIKHADPGLPISADNEEQKLVGRLKGDLGELAENAKLPFKTIAALDDDDRHDVKPTKTKRSRPRVRVEEQNEQNSEKD